MWLSGYIPTEIISLYLPAVGVVTALDGLHVLANTKTAYWAFVALTPVISLVIYLRKRAVAGMKIWPLGGEFPSWEMTAATLVFAAWGLAIPENPDINSPALSVVSGFVALVTWTLLSVVEPFFKKMAAA